MRTSPQLALVALAAAALIGAAGFIRAQERPSFEDSPFLRIDPERIVMSARDARVPCGECHVDEFAVWEETPHATGFNTLHRSEGAADILERMDLQVAKRQESLCMRCHYTVDTSLRAIAGVSCESCHGAARDWIEVHNDLGSGVTTPDQESPEHRGQRIQASIDGGMLRPSGDLYSVAANCFECHTVPIEDLVNTGRHSTGSSRFELVEWADRIRHNYVEAQWTPGAENREPSPERKRVAYAVGKLLDYEFSIRGLARATEDGRYTKGMARRVSDGYRQLEAIATAHEIPEVTEVLRIGRELPLQPGNEDQLLAAADQMRAQGQAFTARSDGTDLGALDGLVEGRTVVAAAPPEEAAGADPGAVAGADPGAAAGADPGAQEAPEAAGADPTPPPETAGEAAVAAPEPPRVTVGQVRARPAWFPDENPAFEVIDPGCGCHGDAEDWWFEDTHESAHFRLLNQEPRAVQIASLYGISTAQMSRGDQICMSCHGMPLSASPAAQVTTGVGCESCHGGSSQYLDPHEDGGNPQLGMRNLKDPAVRAANCSRCHLVTDERLLAAGHPSGASYDFAAANQAIQHFPEGRVERARGRRDESYSAVPASALASAYAAERSSRPVPAVEVVEYTPPAPAQRAAQTPPPVGADQPPQPRSGTRVSTTGGDAVTPPPPVPRPRPVARSVRSQAPARSIDLPPLPAASDSTATEDILLAVKERLEAIRRALGRER
ncbi:MAG: hypothetical protein HKO53_18105 [Gemmatimonadetes bacterium]|nr:hypothetical protein [Gemmatimonadota bacterium]